MFIWWTNTRICPYQWNNFRFCNTLNGSTGETAPYSGKALKTGMACIGRQHWWSVTPNFG